MTRSAIGAVIMFSNWLQESSATSVLRPRIDQGRCFSAGLELTSSVSFFLLRLRHASGIAEQVRKRIEDCRFSVQRTPHNRKQWNRLHASACNNDRRSYQEGRCAANYSAKLLGHNRCHVFAHDDDALERFHFAERTEKTDSQRTGRRPF